MNPINSAAYETLRKYIERDVFVSQNQKHFYPEESSWIMDFRRVCLDPVFLDAYTEEFYERFKDELPFQVGGMEVAAIPLVAAIIMKMREKGKPINGFFIRKSRKKTGLLKMIEGEITDEPIVLVDDLINRGRTFERQLAVIDAARKTVKAIFVILRFRVLEYYQLFQERDIQIESLFTLDDFHKSLGTEIRKELSEASQPPQPIFEQVWCFKSEYPLLESVKPKSGIALDDQRVYFGSDHGTLWALDQLTGEVVWRYDLWSALLGGKRAKSGHQIFSTPALFGEKVYFGAFDGNIYALDAATGKRVWVSFEADVVEGSPLILAGKGVLVIPVTFGLWHRAGGVLALNLETGKKQWDVRFPGKMVGIPVFAFVHNFIVVTSLDGTVYALDGSTGNIQWSFKTSGSLMEGATLDISEEKILFSSMDGSVYAIETRTGNLCWRFENGLANYAAPCIDRDTVYVASLDKHVYALALDSGKLQWQFRARARIFSSPCVIQEKLYVGVNDARLYEIDLKTGKETGAFQVVERITNPLYHDPETGLFYLVTYANEVYCLSKKVDN